MGRRPGNQFLVEFIRCRLAYRIKRVGNDHAFCPCKHLFRHPVQIRQIVVFLLQIVGDHLGPRQRRPDAEDRISRIGHQHHVPRITQRQADMSDPFLGTVDGHDLVLLKRHAIALLVARLHGFDQLRNIDQRVLIVLRLRRSLHHRFHHMRRGRKIRRPHRQVIDCPALPLRLVLLLVQHLKNTGFIVFHPVCKFYVHVCFLISVCFVTRQYTAPAPL